MTLLERLAAPEDVASIATRLRSALGGVPGAVGLAVSHFPSGTRALFVIDEAGDAFLDAEERAMRELLSVRRSFPDSAIDMLCISATDAANVDVPPEATVYSYQ